MARLGNASGNSPYGGASSDGSGWKDRLIMALIAIILGGGGAAGYIGANPPRPDPFTGSMGKALEERLLKRIEAIETADELLRSRVEAHLVRGEAGFWRIEQCEKQLSKLQTEMQLRH